ncbi:hypothetical protein SAMN04515671_0001, partial [Nakamurella panacisegetis]
RRTTGACRPRRLDHRAVLVAVGLRRRIQAPRMTETFGAVAILVGGVMASNGWPGPGLLLLTGSALALVAGALVPGIAGATRGSVRPGLPGAVGTVLAPRKRCPTSSKVRPVATGLVTYVAGLALFYVGDRRLTRLPIVVEVAGTVTVLASPALTWNQWHGFAPTFGAATAVGVVVLGIVRDKLMLSAAGSVGLLVNIPWIIVWYFPGQGRVPLLIAVSGALILCIAVLLARTGHHRHRPAL